jgi:hypothetical protein
MLNKLSDFVWRIAGWKTFLAGLILDGLFMGLIMPRGAGTFSSLSGKEVAVLDLKFSYSPEMARTIIAAYSDSARSFAIKFGLIADTVYPLAYTFFFTMALTWLLKTLSQYGLKVKYLHLFPLVILPIDYLENIAIANLMSSYPTFTDTAVFVASLFTSLKWSAVGIMAAIILSGLVALAGKRLSNQGN